MAHSLVIGLGNPGDKYRGTRHNVGFAVLDKILTINPVLKWHETEFYRAAAITLEVEELHLVWPMTFMNRSGLAVEALLEQFELSADQALVLVDDFNLPLGQLRLRRNGSDGGHNGLASIIETMGDNNFPRLRLGIGPIPEGADSVDFVLGRFETAELPLVESMVARSAEAVIFGVCHSFDEFMSKYNHNPALSEDE